MDSAFAIDIAIAAADETPFPSQVSVISESGDEVVKRDSWGRTVKERKDAYFYQELDVCLKETRDLDTLEFESATLPARYSGFDRLVAAKRDDYAVFCKTGGPYLRSTFVRGETNFLMDIAADPSFAKSLADRIADHLIEIGKESLRRSNLYENGLWIYDDIAGTRQPMMSPSSFEKIFLPAYRRMIKAFKDAGAAKVCFHSDGNIEPLLDMLVDAGIEAINPVEPRAGLHIPTLKAKYGTKLAYIGGMCNSVVLPAGERERIIRMAEEIIEAGRDGGVVIGAHSIGPDVSPQSYLTYHHTVMEKGRYEH